MSLSKVPVPEVDGRPQPRLKGSFGPQGSSLARIGPSLATEVPIGALKSTYLSTPKGPFLVITDPFVPTRGLSLDA